MTSTASNAKHTQIIGLLCAEQRWACPTIDALLQIITPNSQQTNCDEEGRRLLAQSSAHIAIPQHYDEYNI